MNTVKGRIILGVLGILFIAIVVVMGISKLYLNKLEIANSFSSNLYQLHNMFLRDTRIVSDILRHDLVKPEFFISDSTELIKQHRWLLKEELQQSKKPSSRRFISEMGMIGGFDSLTNSLNNYNLLFSELLDITRERGYKDYGIEGKMRQHIHNLEKYNGVNRADILSLRRHEKDYIIRNEPIYIEKLNALSQKVKNDLLNSKSLSTERRDSAIFLLDLYTQYFNLMVQYDLRIGLKTNTGYKAKLDSAITSIDLQFIDIMGKTEEFKGAYYYKLQNEYIIFIVILFLISSILGLYFAHHTSKPLAIFVEHINRYVASNFKQSSKLEISRTPMEISMLIESFNNMVEQLDNREKARLRAESTVVENEIKYREIAELLPVGIFETDANGYIQFVNRSWVKSVGFTKRDIRSKMIFSQVIVNQDFEKLYNGYKTNHVECNVIRKDGSTFNAILITNEVVQNSIKKGIRGIIIDNTERRKIIDALREEKMKAQQSDKLKTAFLANMSHEIRTPMNAIIGFSNLLAIDKDINSERFNEYLGIIKKSGEHLLALIDDIIDIAKIESGEIQINPTVCNPYSIAKDVYNMFAAKLPLEGKPDLVIKFNCELPAEINIHCDSMRLKQVLVNLIGNAIKFTEKGSITLGMQLKDSNFIYFYVADTGIGIESQKQKVIFESFKQADDSIAPAYGGNGLGLAISKNLVELLGGTIWVESILNEGSCFHFTIPYNPVVENISINPAAIPSVHRQMNSYNGQHTILIAEDEESNFIYLRDYLSMRSLRILRAKNGLEAISICLNNPISLVFMDIHMPKLNGYDATRRILQHNPLLPIVAQTAYALPQEREKCIEAGCVDYLSKPIYLNKLSEILDRYLSKQIGYAERNNSAEKYF
jgi:PAS domain S-box-containing protein